MRRLPKLFEIIRNFIDGLAIRRQLSLVYTVAGILPILVIGSYLLLNTRGLVLRQHSDQAKADNIRVRSIVLDVTISLSNMSDDLFTDKALQAILSHAYASSDESYAACRDYNKVQYYATNYTEISQLYVYFSNPTMVDYGHFRRITEDMKGTEWYARASTSASHQWMTIQTKDRGGTKGAELALYRKLPIIGTDEFAVLFFSVSRNYLKSRIDTGPLRTELCVNDGPVFYSNIAKEEERRLGLPLDFSNKFAHVSDITRYNGEEAMVELSTQLPVKGQDRIYVATIDDQAIPDADRITWTSLAIVLISLMLPVGMVALFSAAFNNRVQTLRQEMHKVSGGDLDIIDDFRGHDELGDLYTDLKRMIESIKQRDMEIYNEKIDKQKLITHQQEIQFEMLASQINPHFLYNTLETIRMKSLAAGNREVATAIKLLGKSMRHVLETNGRMATLRSELEYIAVYLDIQKLRFRDKINYEIEMEDSIRPDQYLILPLLLQPVVENAILHGLEDRETGGLIRIAIRRDGAHVEIAISDNGSGMSDERLESLRVHLARPNPEVNEGRKSIGLHNIAQRIRLFYGEDCGMSVDHSPDGGTIVRLRLPPEMYQEPDSSVDAATMPAAKEEGA